MNTERSGHGNGASGPHTVTREQIRGALLAVISSGEGIVALEVRRPGEPALRARLCMDTIELVALALIRDGVLDDEEEDR